jgi:hypothetical protein
LLLSVAAGAPTAAEAQQIAIGQHRRNGIDAAGPGQHCRDAADAARRGQHDGRNAGQGADRHRRVAANKVKTEKLLAAIRAAGIRERDIQTQGIQLQPDYRWDAARRPGRQTLIGYVASNSVQIKTRNIDG